MAFRHLYISNPANMYIKHNQLVISQEEDVSVPLEDIASIVLENSQITITGAALSRLTQNGAVIFTCDEKHTPNGVLYPFNGHSRQLVTQNLQLNASSPLKKRLWQRIVVQKIQNQADALKIFDDDIGWRHLMELSKEVLSGDNNNVEATAANYYFKRLYFESFTREGEDVVNGALNYGYAILRGIITRAISSYGFLPAYGLFHHSQLNNFNLADDLIEPYRPIVDIWVANNLHVLNEKLSKDNKVSLLKLLSVPILFDKKKCSVSTSIDMMVSSVSSAFRSKDASLLLLPTIYNND